MWPQVISQVFEAGFKLPPLSPLLFFSLLLPLTHTVFLELAEKGLLPIWLGGEIKRFTVHRTVNRLRARVRRFRPIYIDIYGGGTRKGEEGTRAGGGEEGRKERVVRRNERLARRERAHSNGERRGLGSAKEREKAPGRHLNKYACLR